MAAVIAKNFFTSLDEQTSLIFTLMAFAAGFAVCPFGALVFGRLGDLVSRKHTFLITILIMGMSTFEMSAAVKDAGYPAKADPAQVNNPMQILILPIMVIYVTMVYGPIAAKLVQMFRTRIRYTSMSLTTTKFTAACGIQS